MNIYLVWSDEAYYKSQLIEATDEDSAVSRFLMDSKMTDLKSGVLNVQLRKADVTYKVTEAQAVRVVKDEEEVILAAEPDNKISGLFQTRKKKK